MRSLAYLQTPAQMKISNLASRISSSWHEHALIRRVLLPLFIFVFIPIFIPTFLSLFVIINSCLRIALSLEQKLAVKHFYRPNDINQTSARGTSETKWCKLSLDDRLRTFKFRFLFLSAKIYLGRGQKR